MTKAKAKPKADEPEVQGDVPTTYILLSGKHSRRLPDGTSEMFYPGDEIPNPTAGELNAFGDKIVTAETFETIAATFAQAKQAEAKQKAARGRKAKASSSFVEPKRDPKAIKRGEVLKEIRADNLKKNIRM